MRVNVKVRERKRKREREENIVVKRTRVLEAFHLLRKQTFGKSRRRRRLRSLKTAYSPLDIEFVQPFVWS